ncbi:MAG: hypothetical protein ACI3YK_00770 [Eubacteriales bacterium]
MKKWLAVVLIAFMLAVMLSVLAGCTEGVANHSYGNQTGKTASDQVEETSRNLGTVTTTTSSAEMDHEIPAEEWASVYYQSDEYKNKYPAQSDLAWCSDSEDNDVKIYPIDVFPFWLCEGTSWKEDQILIYINMSYYRTSNSVLIAGTRNDYDAATRAYFTDHKFAVKVYIIGLTDEVSEDVYPGSYYNEEVFGITDDASRMEFLREEENYFESLGYEIIRNHTVYHDYGGDFILIAMNFTELDSLVVSQPDRDTEYVSFEARLDNEMYVMTIPYYSELGMYEAE